MVKFRTFSPVVGNLICDAQCRFCVAAMTPTFGLSSRKPETNWQKFHEACQLAKEGGAGTVLITGNGEPTLFPEHVAAYLQEMRAYAFGNLELQTNGNQIFLGKLVTRSHLEAWRASGLKTVAISIVHYDPEKNRQNYFPRQRQYIDLPNLVAMLRGLGFCVRLTCILLKGWIDSGRELERLIEFARLCGADQLTATPVNKPSRSRNLLVYDWTMDHILTPLQLVDIHAFLERKGVLVHEMAHGARIYDIDGYRICLSNCLTKDAHGAEEFRNLIFFPSGLITTSWEDEQSVLR